MIFYTHISDQYSPFHTKCISTNARDATYVLDGLLYHDSGLVIEEHYTDTAGFTDQVFGLCHLLGFRFAPRIRDIGERRLYLIGDRTRWPMLEPTFGERIRLHEIESQWDEILRAASSIRLGEVRDRSFEGQSARASGLNLLVAAIVLWNPATWRRPSSEPATKSMSLTSTCGTCRRSAGSTST